MTAPARNLQEIDLDEKMRSSYLDYAMSVIVARALPDVRDGLKPVHRRVLFGMHELHLRHDVPFKKSARVVGDVLGKYHPHGDVAVYETLVRLAQTFAMRYPLVDGQGNFGSIDGDNAAAMRYTEVRLTALAEELLADLEKNTVPFKENFDGSLQEPEVLPARVPLLLLNGMDGIAVGMATKIPPHNMNELCDAVITLIDNPEASVEEFTRVMPGPDFPTGGQIVGREGIDHAYATGQGKITVRATCAVETDRKGREALVVTELPYQVNKAALIKTISDLVRDKKLEGISGLRDESDRSGMRIVVELKVGADPGAVLKSMFQRTNLQVTFGINMLGLIDDRPHVLPLKRALSIFIEHRRQVITRRTEFDLDEANDRRHILEGLKIALDNLDAVITLIRAARTTDEAMGGLVERFGLTQTQARAILDMQLRRLASLERQKVADELATVQKIVRDLEAILASPKKILAILKDDLRDMKRKYGDERRTRILDDAGAAMPTSISDLAPNQETTVALTAESFLKRLDGDPAKVIKGVGGRDPVRQYLVGNQRDTLLLFSASGMCYSMPMHKVSAVARKSERGVAASALVELDPKDAVVAVAALDPARGENTYLIFVTRQGQVKRTLAAEYVNARGGGITALKLDLGDTLVSVDTSEGEGELLISTVGGKAIRFREDEVRPTGRVAGGVRAIKLEASDATVPGSVVLPPGRAATAEVIALTTGGVGKKTRLSEYPPQGRDGGGVRAIRLTPLGGQVAAVLFTTGRAVTLECADESGKITVVENADIPVADRQAPGGPVAPGITVAVMRPR